jgi:hypothetical protein
LKLKDTEGKIISVKIDRDAYAIRSTSRSLFQKSVGEYLKNRFPMQVILEEWPIPGKTGMSLDFLILPIKIAIEVQGEQHIKFVKHFHGNIQGFKRQLERDKKKEDWCKENNIELIKLFSEDNIEEKFL